MPVIDLGPVVGPQGPQGATGAIGAQGIQGLPGPNQVTATTSTNLTGVLYGNGNNVGVAPVDSTPTENSTNLISSGGVAAAEANKLSLSQTAFVETGTTASRAYSNGDYFCWNRLLYRVTAAISVGQSFTPGTNCKATTVGAELNGLSNRLMAFELAPGKSLQIQPGNNTSRLQCLAASSGARTATAILYFLSLYSTNSNYHIISPIVAGSSISVSTSLGATTITNDHPSDTVTIVLQILDTVGTINYTVI